MSETTTVTDAYGNEIEVEVGMDGENPVSPNNPPAKSAFMSEDAYDRSDSDADEASEEDVAEEDSAPNKSDSKADWVAYAVSQGADEEEANSATKDELIAVYGE